MHYFQSSLYKFREITIWYSHGSVKYWRNSIIPTWILRCHGPSLRKCGNADRFFLEIPASSCLCTIRSCSQYQRLVLVIIIEFDQKWYKMKRTRPTMMGRCLKYGFYRFGNIIGIWENCADFQFGPIVTFAAGITNTRCGAAHNNHGLYSI